MLTADDQLVKLYRIIGCTQNRLHPPAIIGEALVEIIKADFSFIDPGNDVATAGGEILIYAYQGKGNNQYAQNGKCKDTRQSFTNGLKNHGLTTFPILKADKKKAP
jgi:hypothetical protein